MSITIIVIIKKIFKKIPHPIWSADLLLELLHVVVHIVEFPIVEIIML